MTKNHIMAEKTVIETRSVFRVADELEQLQGYLRIMRELITDQLCSYSVDDTESMGNSLERIHFLVNLLPEKLEEMSALNRELFSFSKKLELEDIPA